MDDPVGRCSGGAEAGEKFPVDLPEIWILALVIIKRGENPLRRKSKGSLALIIS